MMFRKVAPLFIAIHALFISVASLAQIAAPSDPAHPGSKFYSYKFTSRQFSCAGRDVTVFLPEPMTTSPVTNGKFPVVVYGHGQALDLDAYRATFEHLAKKGVGVVFPTYDNGFFDQDFSRMGADFVRITNCALNLSPTLDKTKVIYAGHSKGAYVASIAAGLAPTLSPDTKPEALVLFESAGIDESTLSQMDPQAVLTVVFSDRDAIVSQDISEKLYSKSPARRRQFIRVSSYPNGPTADHFWPLTKSTLFGGTTENALHYYGSWKWLTAAAMDLNDGGRADNAYIYGNLTADKGVSGLADHVDRTW